MTCMRGFCRNAEHSQMAEVTQWSRAYSVQSYFPHRPNLGVPLIFEDAHA